MAQGIRKTRDRQRDRRRINELQNVISLGITEATEQEEKMKGSKRSIVDCRGIEEPRVRARF